MAIPSLLGSYIDETYQRLVQVSGSEFADGLGNTITFGTIDTSSLVTTASFNSFTSSYQTDSASFVANIFKERKYDSSGSYSYCGTAPQSSPEASNVWSITRILIYSNGSTLINSASMVDWTNRYTHIYY